MCSNQPFEYCGFDPTSAQTLTLLNATLLNPLPDATPGFLGPQFDTQGHCNCSEWVNFAPR